MPTLPNLLLILATIFYFNVYQPVQALPSYSKSDSPSRSLSQAKGDAETLKTLQHPRAEARTAGNQQEFISSNRMTATAVQAQLQAGNIKEAALILRRSQLCANVKDFDILPPKSLPSPNSLEYKEWENICSLCKTTTGKRLQNICHRIKKALLRGKTPTHLGRSKKRREWRKRLRESLREIEENERITSESKEFKSKKIYSVERKASDMLSKNKPLDFSPLNPQDMANILKQRRRGITGHDNSTSTEQDEEEKEDKSLDHASTASNIGDMPSFNQYISPRVADSIMVRIRSRQELLQKQNNVENDAKDNSGISESSWE